MEKDVIFNNRLRELAAYIQFPQVFVTKFGTAKEQYLAVYEEKVDTSVIPAELYQWLKDNPEGDIFEYIFGFEAGSCLVRGS